MDQSADWWARGIGIAATFLSLLALGWNMYSGVFRDRAKLAIKVSYAQVGWSPSALSCIAVEALNTGRRPLTLQNCTFDTDHGRHLFLLPGTWTEYGTLGRGIEESHKTPKRLEEGESHTFFFPLAAIQKAARNDDSINIRGVYVADGTGRKWRESLADSLIQLIYESDQNSAALQTEVTQP